MTDTSLHSETIVITDDGDHDRFTHIVDERRGTVVGSMVEGTPVFAICGHVFRSTRDPKKYPICPTCKEIAEAAGVKVPAR
jgi:hypothetical protein